MLPRSCVVGVAVIGIGCFLASVARAVEPVSPNADQATQPAPVAAGASTPGPISYSASPGCPNEAEFWRQVASHLQTVPRPTLRPIQVEAFELEARAFARVTFAGADASRDVRELSAPNCAEAVAAAALVVALALDARGDEARPLAPTPEPPPRRSKAPDASALPDRSPVPPKDVRGLRLAFGGGGFVEYAIAPTPLFGATAFAGVSGPDQRWDARAGFAYSRTGMVERDSQAAEFSFIGARIDGCAFPFVHEGRFTLHPCLAAALGAVQSHGVDSSLYLGSDESTFWFAGGPLIRARHIFSELSLELYAGPWIPIAGTRTFVFRQQPEGELSFHEVPPVGVLAGASLAFVVP